MPYPTEHSARIKEPADFNKETFRRKADGTIYGSIKVPKTAAVIWAKLLGKDKPADNPIPQAIRFPIKNWTVAKAKKWLKDNNVKYIKFEPATEKAECITCSYKTDSDQHCNELKCPKCGGTMRRQERPGPGQNRSADMRQGIYMREIAAGSTELVIDVIGEIGWEVWYPAMRAMLQSVPETIETVIFDIYSPGGEVWEGNAIITEIGALSQKTIARVQLAASMATLIAVACDEREMASNGRWLIHNPWQRLMGDADAMETACKQLRDCEKEAAEFYARRTGMTVDDARQLMNEERWLTATETKDFGFVAKINDPFDVAAFAGVKAEIVAAGKWPSALVDIPDGGTNNGAEDTSGTQGVETAPDGTPNKPEDAKEYAKGYQAGVADGDTKAAVRVAAEFAGKIEQMDKAVTAAKADTEKKDSQLSKMQGERDSGLARITALQDSLTEAKGKMDKLTAGGMTFSRDVATWEEATTACEGDYVKARKQYPDLYQEERARARETRKKGSGKMRTASIIVAALVFGSVAYGQTMTSLVEVTSYATPTLVEEVNAAIGVANDNFDLLDEGSDGVYGSVTITDTVYAVTTDGTTTNALVTNGVIDGAYIPELTTAENVATTNAISVSTISNDLNTAEGVAATNAISVSTISNDLDSAETDMVRRDGVGAMLADLPMAGSSVTGVQNIVGSGAILMGDGLNPTNIPVNAYGARQHGVQGGGGILAIEANASGASQEGYFLSRSTIISAGARGAQQRGYNIGDMLIGSNAWGASQFGYVSTDAGATNEGRGAMQLLHLDSTNDAWITDEAHGSLGLGACKVSNKFAIVAGDEEESHGEGSITAGGGFYGAGDGITALDAANITAGTVATAIDGNAVTNIDMANLAAGTTAAAFDGSAITALDAANLTAATVASAIDGNAVTNFDMANLAAGTTAAAFDGSAITALDAANLTAATIASAIDGNAVTNLDMANLAAGTTAAAFDGSAITALDAANLTAATIASAIDGNAVTNLDLANLAAGTTAAAFDGSAITALDAANLTAATVATAIDGAAITNVTASNLASGTVPNARLDAELTELADSDRFALLGSDASTSLMVQGWTNVLSAGTHTHTFSPVFTAVPLAIVVQYTADPGNETNRIYAAHGNWVSNQVVVTGDSDVTYSGIAIGAK